MFHKNSHQFTLKVFILLISINRSYIVFCKQESKVKVGQHIKGKQIPKKRMGQKGHCLTPRKEGTSSRPHDMHGEL